MKNYTFRITQPLTAFYEGEVNIKAKNEGSARNKLSKMSQKQLEKIVTDWEQNTENAFADGDINIEELKSIE